MQNILIQLVDTNGKIVRIPLAPGETIAAVICDRGTEVKVQIENDGGVIAVMPAKYTADVLDSQALFAGKN